MPNRAKKWKRRYEEALASAQASYKAEAIKDKVYGRIGARNDLLIKTHNELIDRIDRAIAILRPEKPADTQEEEP